MPERSPRHLPVRLPALTLELASILPATGALSGAQPADTLYISGAILVMAGERSTTVEALAVAGGRIVHASPLAAAPRFAATRVVNLQGRTLLPGFIDTHGHFIDFGKNLIDADLFGAAVISAAGRRQVRAGGRWPQPGG